MWYDEKNVADKKDVEVINGSENMLYCPNCQSLCSDETACPFCGSKKIRRPEQTDPVLLMTADEGKTAAIEAAFSDAGIPLEKRVQGLGGPPSVILGRSYNMNTNLYVAYDDLARAGEVLDGIGIMEQQSAAEGETPEENAEEDEETELSPLKRTVVRIVSAVVFAAIIWAVVTASDSIANALKGFLSSM